MHRMNSEGIEISTPVLSLPSEIATQALAQGLANKARFLLTEQQAPTGLTLHLVGELGVGKTTFVRYFLQTLGIVGRIKSPTYGLTESYDFAPHFEAWHFDFYRLENPSEWSDSGLIEVWSRPVLRLVEWPQNAGTQLPAPNLSLGLTWPDATSAARLAQLTAVNALGENWLIASSK